jgi:hypothetical protein
MEVEVMATSRIALRGVAAAGLLSLAMAAACGEQSVSGPELKPSSAIINPPAGQTYWNFVTLNGAPAAVAAPDIFYSPSRQVCNNLLGCVTLSTNTTGVNVLFKWHSDDIQPEDEQGVGMCKPYNGVCEGDEVGNVDGAPWLLLDLNGLAAGIEVTGIVLGSLTTTTGAAIESYKFDLCTLSSGGACGAELTGNGSSTQSIYTIPVTQGANKWVRFKPNSGDYTVAGIITSVATPPPPPEEGEGRMTGGGRVPLGDLMISYGFTLHCDILLSNNLEINWKDNKWHLDKPITSATCTDDPLIAPPPPVAPFDTFVGTGIGKLNGVAGSRVEFTFKDAGEPGKDDWVQLKVFAPNSNTVVLDVPLKQVKNGNIQAHYDQPHGNKP